VFVLPHLQPQGVTGLDQGINGLGQGVTGNGHGVTGHGQGVTGHGQGVTEHGQGIIGLGQGITGLGQGVTGNGHGVTGHGQGVIGHGQGVTGHVATGPPLSCGVFSTGKPVDLSYMSILKQKKMLTRFVACIETTSFLDIDGLYFSFIDNLQKFNYLTLKRWDQKSKYTGLMAATALGFNNLARTLIRYDANINIQNEHGTTSLHRAAMAGNNEMVGILLGLNVPVNKLDNWGDTPLHYAATGGHVRTVRLLFEKGASLTVMRSTYQSRWTAIQTASRAGHQDVVNLLKFLMDGGDLMTVCRNL